ncbi:CvpA family protein [Blattabacterium cuenoti]|uniref:CvpA family protein n=1 Tax=Blattabacterium cuenoti TaxID=1653831 RepID=UPI00163C31FC|nr:CvpA family protein [Blattabacterium cuenoti]
MVGTDIIILIIVLYGACKGYRKGLLSQLFVFIICFFFLYKGINVFHFVSEKLLKKYSKEEPFFTGFSLIISFFFIIFIAFLTKNIIEIIFKITWIKPFDQGFGGLLGLIKYFFYLSIWIFFLKEANKKINLIPYNFFSNSFEKEFQYIFDISRKEFLFFFKKLEELYFLFSNIIQ